MPVAWNDAGCAQCHAAMLTTIGSPLKLLGEDVTGFIELLVCENCGQFWELNSRLAKGLMLSEVKKRFPGVNLQE